MSLDLETLAGLRLPDRGGSVAESRETSLRYFAVYRLAVATVFLVAVLAYGGSVTFGGSDLGLFRVVAATYWVVALVIYFGDRFLGRSIPLRLTLHVALDLAALLLLMHASGGYRSGLAFMILIVLAGAGLIVEGRLAVFYAALAVVGILLEQTYRLIGLAQGDSGDFVPVAITCVVFFGVAIVARLIGRRVTNNEALAIQRGMELSNQLHLNERVIRDMQDGVIVLDEQMRVRQWNPQAVSLVGVALAPAAPLETVLPELAGPLADQTRSVESLVKFRSGDGARMLAARMVPLGEPGDTLVYIEDLGRIQQQARELKLAALGRLTANIAHEIRNPLSAITHAADLLREEKRAETQARLIRIINDNSQRIERLVKDVLELGRRDRVHPEDIELAPFLESFIDELHLQSGNDAERVSLDCAEGVRVRFDRVHLNQIVVNLIGNALRYASAAPGAVRVEVAQAGAAIVELRIIDDGPGVPDNLRTQVFEPFVTTHSQGTGLGLYIARELAAANGAELELLDSAPGAHFKLTFRTNDE